MTIKLNHLYLAFLLVVLPLAGASQGQRTIREVGNCIVVEVSNGTGAAPDIKTFCENTIKPLNFPGGADFKQLYEWAGPLLGASFEWAERAHCASSTNKETCLSQNLFVRIILVPNSLPGAWVSRKNNELVVIITTGMITFPLLTARAYMVDLRSAQPGKAIPNGLNSWLDTMQAMGGKSCADRVPFPGKRLENMEEFKTDMTVISQTLFFIFGHELAHVKTRETNFNCGYTGNDPLKLEAACDQMATKALFEQGKISPLFIVATNTAMRFWQNFHDPALAKLMNQPLKSFTDIFPAFNWKERTALIINEWESQCSANASRLFDTARGVIMCPPAPGWREAIAEARRLNSLVAPDKCSLNATGNTVGNSESCSVVNELISKSRSNFADVKGAFDSQDEEDGTKFFASKLTFPGAESCEVREYKDSPPIVRCKMPKPESFVAAEALFAKTVMSMKKCLPALWTIREKTSPEKSIKMLFMAEEKASGPYIRVAYSGKTPETIRLSVTFESPEKRQFD